MTNEQGRDLTAPFWTLSEIGTLQAIPNKRTVFDHLTQNPTEKNTALLAKLLECVERVKNDPTGNAFLEADKPMLYEVWFFWLKQFEPTGWAVYRNKTNRGGYVPYGYGCSAVWKNVRLCLCYSYLGSDYYKSLPDPVRIPIYALN